MTVVVTRDVALRFRGFLTSCMLEIAPGVYVQPAMSVAVRERVWTVLQEWHTALGGAIVMTWAAPRERGRLGIRTLGDPPKDVVEYDGVFLCQQQIISQQE